MKRIIRYKLKADRVADNERHVSAVFEELHRLGPPDFRYASFKLEDGLTFVHVVSHETEAASQVLMSLPTFKAFLAGLRKRCEEPPVNMGATEIGAYEFFAK